ncbi:hypothetical protein [Streptomyces sp. NPDC020298]
MLFAVTTDVPIPHELGPGIHEVPITLSTPRPSALDDIAAAVA